MMLYSIQGTSLCMMIFRQWIEVASAVFFSSYKNKHSRPKIPTAAAAAAANLMHAQAHTCLVA